MSKTSGVTRSEPLSVKDKRDATPLRCWRPGIMTWFIVGGMILVVFAMFVTDVTRIRLHHWLYRIDFRHWPMSLGIAFWLLFIWLVLDTVVLYNPKVQTIKSEKIMPPRKNRFRWIVNIINACLLVPLAYFSITAFFTWREVWQWFYFSILIYFYYEPMTLFFYNGTFTKRLIIPPLTAIAAIGFLLYLHWVFKKRGHHDNAIHKPSDT